MHIDSIRQSLETFGHSYLRRVFTPAEIAFARAGDPDDVAGRLAECFAAKEAAFKASGRGEAPVWRAMDVRCAPGPWRLRIERDAEYAVALVIAHG